MENYLILSHAPFEGFMPDDIRNWLSSHSSDPNLALVMEKVNYQVGMLMHECDESNDPWVKYSYSLWWELYLELKDEIVPRLAKDNLEKGSNHQTDGGGYHYLIKPFMERNGYRDGSGWWIKQNEERDFDWVRGKVPRYNQDGDDISDEELGAGGRRREDGKLAGLAYDLEYYDPDEDNNEDSDSVAPDSSDRYAEGILAGLAIAAAAYVGGKAVKWAAPKVKRGGKKALAFVKKKLHIGKEETEIKIDKPIERIEIEPETSSISMPDFTDLDVAYEEYHRDMSSEEIQRHLVNIAVH